MSAYIGLLKLIIDKWEPDNQEAKQFALSLITVATNLNHDIFGNEKTSDLLNLYSTLYESKGNNLEENSYISEVDGE